REDAERFAKGVYETGGRVDADARVVGSDPVVNLALVFEREMDLPLAAAEMGVSVTVLVKAMDASPAMARALGVLKVEGGTIQRQAFVVIFRDLVQDLKIGVFISVESTRSTAGPAAAPSAPSAPLKPGERLF